MHGFLEANVFGCMFCIALIIAFKSRGIAFCVILNGGSSFDSAEIDCTTGTLEAESDSSRRGQVCITELTSACHGYILSNDIAGSFLPTPLQV